MELIDVRVRVAGIVAQVLALALGRAGFRVALDAEPAGRAERIGEDVRAFALNAASVRLLQSVKVWDALPPHAATAVRDMHVRGDALEHPGQLDFSAWEQRVGELAWIVDAGALEREFGNAVRFSPHVSSMPSTNVGGGKAAGLTDRVPLTAICEGRDSAQRAALGASFECHRYGHRAIAARVRASEGHRGAAHQWFKAPEVLALLPFDAPDPGRSYALVWSVPDARADALLALDDAAFEAALAEATQGACGTLRLGSRRMAWPLMVGKADPWCGNGWVLVGDAAHVIHPLAGQGLNLGLADVTALVEVLTAREPWRALGDERLLRRYVRRRAASTWAMMETTDGLLRLFSHEGAGFRELRNQGLTLANKMSALKRWLAARALDS